MSASKLEAGQLIIEAFKAALDTIDNFVGNDGPAYERAKRGLDVAEEFFRTDQPQPAEDPDEWVIQDKVAPRKGVDEIHWSDWPEDIWVAVILDWPKHKKHGYLSKDLDCILSVRCRRRDLPKVEQAPQPQKTRVSDEALELITHLRDQMDALSKRVIDCEKQLMMAKAFGVNP